MNMPEINHKVIREPQETIARIESKVAEAARKAELAATAAKAAVEEDVTRRAEAYEHDKAAPAPKANAAREAAEAAQLDVAALRQALANAEARLDQAREANKAQLVASERKELEKVTKDLLSHLDAATDATGKMREIKKRILWLSSGRAKGAGQLLVPAIPGEGGEEHVQVERIIEALKAFARDPNPQRPAGPQRMAYEPGTVRVPSEPMIETLA
jgi:hypothetical protein